MGTRIGTAILATLGAATISAQPYHLGRALSDEFLTRLVQHRLEESQVAVINASVSSVMIFDSQAPGPVEYIDGEGNFVWAQIAHQLADSLSQKESLHVDLGYRSIGLDSCPAMAEQLGEFLAQLNAFVPSADDQSSIPPLQVIVVDSTAFKIITSGPTALVVIEPNGSLDPPLQQAAGRLHSHVSRCAGSIVAHVQQHDF